MTNNKASCKINIFLETIHNKDTKEAFSSLNDILEILENKNDPDPEEMLLVESLHRFNERFNALLNNLKTYSRKNKNNIRSDILSTYYDTRENIYE